MESKYINQKNKQNQYGIVSTDNGKENYACTHVLIVLVFTLLLKRNLINNEKTI